MGLFLALWGKKRMLPFCSKIYGGCAGQARSSTELKARAGGAPAPAPEALPPSMAPEPTWPRCVTIVSRSPVMRALLGLSGTASELKLTVAVKIKQGGLLTLIRVPSTWLRGAGGWS